MLDFRKILEDSKRLLGTTKQFGDRLGLNHVPDAPQSPQTNEDSRFNMNSILDRVKPFMALLANTSLKNTIEYARPQDKYNPEHIKELAATVYGEASSNKEEMQAIIDTALNRRNQLGLNIKEVLTQKDKTGASMYRAYGDKQYQQYMSGKFDGAGEPEKKKMVDELIDKLQTGNWKTSEYTNFEKLNKEGRTKIGEHYFWKQFQGNRKK